VNSTKSIPKSTTVPNLVKLINYRVF